MKYALIPMESYTEEICNTSIHTLDKFRFSPCGCFVPLIFEDIDFPSNFEEFETTEEEYNNIIQNWYEL